MKTATSFRFASSPEHKKCFDKDKNHTAEQLAAAVFWQSPDGCRVKGGITSWHTWKWPKGFSTCAHHRALRCIHKQRDVSGGFILLLSKGKIDPQKEPKSRL